MAVHRNRNRNQIAEELTMASDEPRRFVTFSLAYTGTNECVRPKPGVKGEGRMHGASGPRPWAKVPLWPESGRRWRWPAPG